MKIKVTFYHPGGKDTTVTMEIPQETIADLLKDERFAAIANEASAKTGGRTRYGYVRKIEDMDF